MPPYLTVLKYDTNKTFYSISEEITLSNNNVVFARMEPSKIELVKQVSKARGETVSSFVRRAVFRELAGLSYISKEEKKALGVKSIE